MERVLAIVILIGVAIAFSLVGAMWLITTFFSFAQPPAALKIIDASIEIANGSWVLRVMVTNVGEVPVDMYKIVVENSEEISLSKPITIAAGETKNLVIQLTKQYTPYTDYTIRLYLKTGTIVNGVAHVK